MRFVLALVIGVAAGFGLRWALEPGTAQYDGPSSAAAAPAPGVAAAMTPPARDAADERSSPRPRKPGRSSSPEPGPAPPERPRADEGGAPASFPPEAAAMLREIETAAADPDGGARALELAKQYVRLDRKPNVPARLVQSLIAKGGDFRSAGGYLFGWIACEEAAAEFRGIVAGAASASAWGTSESQREIAVGFLDHIRDFAEHLTDEDVLAVAACRDATLRRRGLSLAKARKLLSCDALLIRARTDADSEVRVTALLCAMDSALDEDPAVADEILAFARSSDELLRTFGLEHLGETGARGAALARELLDQGGLDADVYAAAVTSLIAARRFDRLATENLDDESRVRLLDCLWDAVAGDETTRAQVLETIRGMGPPRSAEEVGSLIAVARQAHALEFVFDAAKSKSASAEVRAFALTELMDDEESRAQAVTLAGEIVGDAATPAAERRVLLVKTAESLLRSGDAGVAIVRHVAANDADAQIRSLAARLLRKAGK
jgi:hypothetical protein